MTVEQWATTLERTIGPASVVLTAATPLIHGRRSRSSREAQGREIRPP